jgi:hypothetical protein
MTAPTILSPPAKGCRLGSAFLGLALLAGGLTVWLMLGSLAWVTGAAAWRENYPVALLAAGALGLGLTPPWVRRRCGLALPCGLEFFIALQLCLHTYWGVWLRYYDRYWFWDKLLHFQGTGLVSFVAFLWLESLRAAGRVRLSGAMPALLAVAVGNALGAWWEIGEFCVDKLLSKNTQYGLDNTMWDLINNLLGSLVAAGLGWLYTRRQQSARLRAGC